MNHPRPAQQQQPQQHNPLEKLQAALASLRRERDLEYRAMAEAQERERLAHDELKSLQAIVDQLQAEKEKLAHDKGQVLAQVGPLEKEVLEMDQKVRTTQARLNRFLSFSIVAHSHESYCIC